ncbi:MAG: transcriptional regulator, partial [Halobacteriales archaeon]|nr:transcriptional regulator [Halobacteriales archaeon]
FVEKEQVNYEHGGYYHVYRPVDPDAVADEMASLVEEWHGKMTELVSEFREQYGERVSVERVAE